jgi:hypothetical protein
MNYSDWNWSSQNQNDPRLLGHPSHSRAPYPSGSDQCLHGYDRKPHLSDANIGSQMYERREATKEPTLSSSSRAPQHYYNSNYLENERRLERTSHMQYPDNYQSTGFLQSAQKNLILNPNEHYLSIDSSDRDREKYPNPFRYTINMVGTSDTKNVTGRRYKNVHSIELMSAILPNIDEIRNQMYIVLEIEELEDVGYDSSNPVVQRAFSKIVLCQCAMNGFLTLDGDNSRPLYRVFFPSPRASIDRLTICIKTPTGNIITIPDNPPDEDPIKELQNSFTFRIVEKITDTEPLGHRNI